MNGSEDAGDQSRLQQLEAEGDIAADYVIGFSNNCYLSYTWDQVDALWRDWCDAWDEGRIVGEVSRHSLVGPIIPRPIFVEEPAPARAQPAGLRTWAVTTTTYYVPEDAPAFLNMPNPGDAHPTS